MFLAMGDEAALRVNRRLVLTPAELCWRFSRSGGPGGQHANTADTRVELLFDVEGSAAPGPRQRARLLERFGPVVRVVVSAERSQARNRELARERLAARLRDGLRVERPRQRTQPTEASRQKRLKDKRLQAERKAQRRRPGVEE
jgi:ribosome-associated protein